MSVGSGVGSAFVTGSGSGAGLASELESGLASGSGVGLASGSGAGLASGLGPGLGSACVSEVVSTGGGVAASAGAPPSITATHAVAHSVVIRMLNISCPCGSSGHLCYLIRRGPRRFIWCIR